MRKIADALLERYLADDLPAPLRAQLDETLPRSAEDAARLAELRGETAAFLARHPPAAMAERLTPRRRRWVWSLFAIPVAAAATLLLLPAREPDVSAKGGVSVAIFAQRGTDTFRVGPADELAPGDRVRFEVRSATAGYAAVLGRDAAGAVTLYAPFGGTAPRAYDPRAPLLDDTIALDAGEGAEDVYALVSSKPFSLAAAQQALRDGRALDAALPGVAVGHARLAKRQARGPR